MRTTKNERFLLLVLAAILFLIGNFYGYRWVAQKQAGLQLACAQLKADQAEAKVDLQESDAWAQCQAWIRDHEPAMGDEGETKAAVFEFVSKGARDNKLEIMDQNLKDVEHGAAGTRVNTSIKVKGSMQDLCKWLAPLEDPGQFYAITSFSLKADQDQKSMVCDLQIARYFKDKEGF